jgi:hypothetical protein
VLVRNAHSVAVSYDFFAFQQQIKQFFGLLQSIPRAAEFEREEVHPVLKPVLVHAPVEPDEILHVGAIPVDRFKAALTIEFVDRLLALVRQPQPRDQLVMGEIEVVDQSRPGFYVVSEGVEHLRRARLSLPLDRRHRLLAGPQSHGHAPLVPREAAVSLAVRPELDLGMGHGEVLLVDVDLAREDDGILPAPQGREGFLHPVKGSRHRYLCRLRRLADGRPGEDVHQEFHRGFQRQLPLVDQASARGGERPSAPLAAISREAAFGFAPPDGLARFPAYGAGGFRPRLGDEAGVLARALVEPRVLGVVLGLYQGLFLVLRRLENVAPSGVEGSPVWHLNLLWISGGRRRGLVARPDPRGAGHVKSILDLHPIWQRHYTPKPKCAQESPTPCTRVILFFRNKYWLKTERQPAKIINLLKNGKTLFSSKGKDFFFICRLCGDIFS